MLFPFSPPPVRGRAFHFAPDSIASLSFAPYHGLSGLLSCFDRKEPSLISVRYGPPVVSKTAGVGHELFESSPDGIGAGLRHDSVSEESQFIGTIVTGFTQLGVVQPTGNPIRVSTQRGLSLALG